MPARKRLSLAPPTKARETAVAKDSFNLQIETKPSLSTEDFEQLRAWRDRHQASMGRVLTLPGGQPPEQIQRAADYLRGMVERLGGEDLREGGINLVVNLYSGDAVNAAMIGHKADGKGEELIRRRLNFDNGEPFYEMAVNVGLLNTVGSEEELAFVLSHELIHLFEKHVDPERGGDPARAWLAGQTHEAVADNHGIARMVRAGYNPEGALALLNRLFQGQRPADASDAISALASSVADHHAEGVRVSLAQAEIERLRRLDPDARQQEPLQPLPEVLKLHVRPRTEVLERNLEGMKKEVAKITTSLLLDPAPQTWLTRNPRASAADQKNDPPQLQALKASGYRPTRLQLQTVLDSSLDVIAASDAKPQDKVDGALRLLQMLQVVYPNRSTEPPLNASTSEKLSALLQKNSQGPEGWKADAWLEKLSGDTTGESPLRQFAYNVFLSPELGQAFAPLVQESPQWAKLMSKVPELLIVDPASHQPNDIGWVSDVARTLAKGDSKGPLDGPLKESLLSFFETAELGKFVEVVEPREGTLPFLSLARKFYAPDLAPPESPFLSKIRERLHPHVEHFQTFIVERSEAVLSGALEIPADHYPWLFRELAWSAEAFPIGPEAQKNFDKGLVNLARRANHDPDFQLAGSLGVGLDSTAKGLAAPLARLLDDPAVSADDKHEVAVFLFSNAPSDSSFPAHGAQADSATSVAKYLAALSKADLLQLLARGSHPEFHDRKLSEGLSRILDRAPVDVDHKTLAALAEQEKAANAAPEPKEGEPGYSAHQERQAKRRSPEFRAQMDNLAALLSNERNAMASPLSYLGTNREISQQVAKDMSLDDLKSVLTRVEAQQAQSKAVSGLVRTVRPRSLSGDAGVFLLDSLLNSQNQATDLSDWYSVTQRIIDLSPTAIQGRAEYRQRLGEFLQPHLSALPAKELREWLAKPYVLDALQPAVQGQLLAKLVNPNQSPEALGDQVAQLSQDLQLTQKHPEGFHDFGDRLAEAAKLQPGTLEQVFPQRERSLGDKESVILRGLSGMVSLTRTRPANEQIEMIDYLMGRQPKMPEFVTELTREAQSTAPVNEMVSSARTELLRADTTTRVLVANSFLAGPSALIRDPAGMRALQEHLLKDVSPKHQDLAHRIAEALVESQGSSDSLALAYVIGQRPDESGKLSESKVLNSLFDAYGVPGVKFKQYLAFTSEFKEFREAFSEAQDNALPVSYRQAISLINERFGGNWPPDLEIDKILGSGSVNVAMRYFNPESGQKEVISIGRKDIEKSTEYDFFRFKNLLSALNKTPEDQQKFGYLLGLTDVIHDSVALEFDKAAVLDMQKQVQSLYDRKINGWNIRTLDAFKQENMALFMEEAHGKSARKMLEADPATYRSAMHAMSQVETDSLLGIDEHGKARPVPLHANPDFHDGQVLIDPETRTVTILDFGQAVPITNQERDKAIDLLRVISKAESPKSALRILQKDVPELTSMDLDPILRREDRMDVFVHLLSLLGQKGYKVPISQVHWIMAMHRQVALGEKIGAPTESMVRNLMVVKKLGGSLRLYNHLHLANQQAQRLASALLPGPLGLLLSRTD